MIQLKLLFFLTFLTALTFAQADWIVIERDDRFDIGLSQEWNLPPLRDDFYSILMTKTFFQIEESGVWQNVWNWCNKEYTNRCRLDDGNYVAAYVNIYKIDCTLTKKRFQILNNYWLGSNGDEFPWNMGVDLDGAWVNVYPGDILDLRIKQNQVCG